MIPLKRSKHFSATVRRTIRQGLSQIRRKQQKVKKLCRVRGRRGAATTSSLWLVTISRLRKAIVASTSAVAIRHSAKREVGIARICSREEVWGRRACYLPTSHTVPEDFPLHVDRTATRSPSEKDGSIVSGFSDFGRKGMWRKRRDSNPRYPFRYASFQDWSHQPLGHSSCCKFSTRPLSRAKTPAGNRANIPAQQTLRRCDTERRLIGKRWRLQTSRSPNRSRRRPK